MPRLSVVIPNFNHAQHLPGAIDSSLRASEGEVEIIVVDDASTDGSLEVAREWAQRSPLVRLLRNDQNLGVERSLNRGLAEATGEFVLFRAADDITLPGFVDAAKRQLKRHPRAPFCLGDTRFFGEDPDHGRGQAAGIGGEPRYVAPARWNETFGGNELSVCAAIIRREVMVDLGGFDVDLRWISDWAVLAELGVRRGFVYFPQPACAMRMSPVSYNSAGSQDDSRQLEIFARLLNRWAALDERAFYALKDAAILDFFSTALRRIAPALRARIVHRAAELLDVVDRPSPSARAGCGMRAALRQFLAENETRLRQARGVALFGAGGHTALLLEVWRDTALPQPRGIFASAVQNSDHVDGIPVRRIDEAPAGIDFDLVVLSSKSYEPALAELAAKHLPGVNVLRIWT